MTKELISCICLTCGIRNDHQHWIKEANERQFVGQNTRSEEQMIERIRTIPKVKKQNTQWR